MPELNYKNLLELGKEYVKERPIAFQSFAHYDFFEWLRQRESAQQSVQPTCSTCGAKLHMGDIWWNECEKCHSKIASG